MAWPVLVWANMSHIYQSQELSLDAEWYTFWAEHLSPQTHMFNSVSQFDCIWSNEEIMHVKKMSEEKVLNLLILGSF